MKKTTLQLIQQRALLEIDIMADLRQSVLTALAAHKAALTRRQAYAVERFDRGYQAWNHKKGVMEDAFWDGVAVLDLLEVEHEYDIE